MQTALPNLAGEDRATAINDLGLVRASLRHFGEARSLLANALAIYEGPGYPAARAMADSQKYGIDLLSSRRSVCCNLFLRASDFDSGSALGKNHPHVGMAMAEYSRVLRKSGRKSEAKYIEHRAKAILIASPLRQQSTFQSWWRVGFSLLTACPAFGVSWRSWLPISRLALLRPKYARLVHSGWAGPATITILRVAYPELPMRTQRSPWQIRPQIIPVASAQQLA